MKLRGYLLLVTALVLSGCANPPPAGTATPTAKTAVTSRPTLRFTMLPTWTPSNTPIPKATRPPRNTSTPLVTAGWLPTFLWMPTTEILVDRPSYAQLAKPQNLVTLEYDPSMWMLNTSYPSAYLGYSLSYRSIYGCKLEPTISQETEGSEVETYTRTLGETQYKISRVSQGGILQYANYCTGGEEDATCYQMTPGDHHEACTNAAEGVLGTYQLIANPFFESPEKSPNRWICQDTKGTVGLCLISYSVPLNALAFTPDGQAWAAGDGGMLLQRTGQVWTEISSPATHPLYDLNFTSATNGWAVGDGAEVLHWDGSAWEEILPYHAPGEGPGGSTQVLYAIDLYAANEAWLVGVTKGIDGKNRPYALHWNGKDLLEDSSFPDCNCGLNAVVVRGQDDVYAAGGSDLGAVIFHWDGSSWTSTSLAGADHLYAFSQAADGTLWVSGIEVARDQLDTRGVLFHWDGSQWQRAAVPPLTGGIYALSATVSGQIVVGGDFTALRAGLEWQPISSDIAGYGWIVDIEQDPQYNVWALTHTGNLFELGINR